MCWSVVLILTLYIRSRSGMILLCLPLESRSMLRYVVASEWVCEWVCEWVGEWVSEWVMFTLVQPIVDHLDEGRGIFKARYYRDVRIAAFCTYGGLECQSIFRFLIRFSIYFTHIHTYTYIHIHSLSHTHSVLRSTWVVVCEESLTHWPWSPQRADHRQYTGRLPMASRWARSINTTPYHMYIYNITTIHYYIVPT